MPLCTKQCQLFRNQTRTDWGRRRQAGTKCHQMDSSNNQKWSAIPNTIPGSCSPLYLPTQATVPGSPGISILGQSLPGCPTISEHRGARPSVLVLRRVALSTTGNRRSTQMVFYVQQPAMRAKWRTTCAQQYVSISSPEQKSVSGICQES